MSLSQWLWIFCVKCEQSGLGLIFRNVKKKKGTSHRYLFGFKFPYRVAAFCLPLECVCWRVSTGFGMWEAGSQSNGCCCGQVVAAISLLCMADILLQWAVSTHRHFIHMGQQAGLPTPHIHPMSHDYHKQAFSVSCHTKFLLYFEAQPDSLSISGKIPVRKFFMAYMEPRSVSRQHMVSQRE